MMIRSLPMERRSETEMETVKKGSAEANIQEDGFAIFSCRIG